MQKNKFIALHIYLLHKKTDYDLSGKTSANTASNEGR